jgi:hypothetical protein
MRFGFCGSGDDVNPQESDLVLSESAELWGT